MDVFVDLTMENLSDFGVENVSKTDGEFVFLGGEDLENGGRATVKLTLTFVQVICLARVAQGLLNAERDK